jgi:hypothetical protein
LTLVGVHPGTYEALRPPIKLKKVDTNSTTSQQLVATAMVKGQIETTPSSLDRQLGGRGMKSGMGKGQGMMGKGISGCVPVDQTTAPSKGGGGKGGGGKGGGGKGGGGKGGGGKGRGGRELSDEPVVRDLRTNPSGGGKGSSNDSVAPVRVAVGCGNPFGLYR